jgi:N,N'-diacetyllegionaminate synthase
MQKVLSNPGSESDRCLIVAEVAQAHDGSLGTAHAYIDAAAGAGADAIKFQAHIAAEESTPDEPWRVKFSPQDATRYAYWERIQFTPEQWAGLKRHADDAGVKFLCSPFSLAAVDLLRRVGVHAWKVASGEVSNLPMLDAMLRTGLPVFLSSGMSSYEELDAAVARGQAAGSDLVVMQCTSEYPCPPEKVGLNLVTELHDRYGCRTGLSDHSGTIFAGLAARMLGISVLEIHVTFSRAMFGPDVPASITFEELRELARGMRFIETALAHPLNKDEIATEKAEMRRMFGRSIVAAEDLAAGTLLAEQHLALRKPGTGLPPGELPSVVGRTLRRAVQRNERLQREDVE